MSIEIRGLDRLLKKLGAAGATQTLVRPMGRAVLRIQKRMQEYPPPLAAVQGPASGPVRFTTSAGKRVEFIARRRKPYRRTGTYGKRWTFKIAATDGGLVGRVGNNVAYAPFVGSARFQARIHQGRWNTDERVVREEAPGILADFQREIDRALAE